MNRRGDWMQTYPTGTQFWPLDPLADEVHIEDIAHALSQITRFCGHCRAPYSVGQHCVLASRNVVAGSFLLDALWYRQTWETPKTRAVTHPTDADRFAMFTRVRLAALLHDAAEAYVGDVIRPLKRHLPEYQTLYQRVDEAIAQRFGLPRWMFEMGAVKTVDARLLMTEKRDLLAPAPAPWGEPQGVKHEPFPFAIEVWEPARTRAEFMGAFEALGGRR